MTEKNVFDSFFFVNSVNFITWGIMKKSLIITLLLACCTLNATSNCAIAKENGFFQKFKKNQVKQIRIEKQKEEQSIEDINNNLLTPNESPGILTDPNKTKRYYDSVRDTRKNSSKKELKKEELIEKAPLKLPARIHEDSVTTHINSVEMSNSEIFSKEEIKAFKSLVEGQEVTAEDLNNLVALINQQYREKNVLTARAYLVADSLADGVLKIELMEARIGKVYVEGNRFNRKWFLKRMVSKRDGKILDIKSLEDDLVQFNKNARSVQLSAKLKPGETYGTTDVVLKADEKFPYHFIASYDSFGRDTTGLMRGGLMLTTDSFLGFQDRLTGAINMARSSTTPFVDYNFPINRKGTRVGFTYMYGNNHVTSGQYRDFKLRANTHIFSGYITHPLKDTEKFSLNFNTSANIKLSTASVYDIKYSNYKDYNIAVGLGGRYNFKKSVLFASVYSTNGIIEDGMRDFSNFFTKVNADGYYIHYLPKGIIATVRVGGQYSPNNISYIEQYQIGGISSVRGYTESLLLAPKSYFASVELLFPIPFLPETIRNPFDKEQTFRLRDAVKFATFFDHGAVYAYHVPTGSINFLASVGAGLRFAISKYITARFYVGLPLMNCSVYRQSSARLHFDLVVSPF